MGKETKYSEFNKKIILYNTIKENFSKFPEPYKTQALANLSLKFLNLNNSHNSIKEMLLRGFDWEFSKEGYDYWEKFYYSLIDVEKKLYFLSDLSDF